MTTESKMTDAEADISVMELPVNEPVPDEIDEKIENCEVLDPLSRHWMG